MKPTSQTTGNMSLFRSQKRLGFTRNCLLLLAISRYASSLATPRPQTVAIIGGGVAGLSCAQQLASSPDYDVTVFDTGRLRPGGRCSTRFPGDRPKEEDENKYPVLSEKSYDHASQLVSVPVGYDFAEFREQMRLWTQKGILKPFPSGSVFRVRRGSLEDLQPSPDAPLHYYAPGGMSSIPQSMASSKSFHLEQDVWVSPSNGARYVYKKRQWKLQAKGQSLGEFDHLIIAHNGKCADRLMSKTPARQVHSLLRVNFASSAPPTATRMTLNSIYSLTFCLPKGSVLSRALPPHYMCGFVENVRDLTFLTCQSNKFACDDESHEVWTVLSSATFAKKHKAPQEFLPEETVEEVSTLLFAAVEKLLNLPEESLAKAVVDKRLQLWGAALPLNKYENGADFVYDSEFKVGVCGDWLVESSIAGAWTSGHALANHLQSNQRDKSVGLEGTFQRSERTVKAGIGALA